MTARNVQIAVRGTAISGQLGKSGRNVDELVCLLSASVLIISNKSLFDNICPGLLSC
jgi:hypothetical protein